MKLTKIIAGASIIAFALAATPALATAEVPTKVRKCDSFEIFQEKTLSRINNHEEKFKLVEEKKLDHLTAQNDLEKTRILNRIQKENERMSVQFSALRNKATTDTQKAAVETYISQVNEANNVRVNRINDAIATYNTALNNLISVKNGKVNETFSSYKQSAQVVTQDAVDSCRGGVENSQIRQTLNSSIKYNRALFNDGMHDINDLRKEIGALKTVRDNSIRDANSEFKKKLAEFKAVLATAL